jgi:phosphatidylinositol alpha-1,6-mannosyltransferase
MRSIALVSDAYGGRGGIALYNRNFLRALCSFPAMEEVVALPRTITYDLEKMPENMTYVLSAVGSKLRYLAEVLRLIMFGKRVDLIVCGHIHLLPFAYLLKFRHRCPVIPLTYGVEAWTPTSHVVSNFVCSRLDAFVSIRKLTAHRFRNWAKIADAKFYYLPNCIDELQYGVAPKNSSLVEKFGLKNAKVLMTAGRLDSSQGRKGFDEILEILPELRKQVPEVVYLIVGDGDDKERLAAKADRLGVGDVVLFAGYVSVIEKADYYRLADVFAMPGSDPNFDRYPFRFVFLEALACGVPVVGCMLEDESELNDSNAKALIIQVDSNDRSSILEGIIEGFSHSDKKIPAEMENYFYQEFEKNLHGTIDDILKACHGNEEKPDRLAV